MGKWNDYTTKTALKDNDELMILDKDANANKRTLMVKVWDYVVDKMTTAVIAKLGTTNKTLIGAVNELNSKSLGTAKIVDAGTVVLNEHGYYNLSNDFKELAGATLVIVSYYYEIKPVSAISIYCSGYNCYVFGLPNTTIAGLRVRYWQ